MSNDADDEDVLKGYDLDAWETPAAPEDLAERVLARLGEAEVGAAVPVETAGSRRRAWRVAGVAAAVLAAMAGTYSLIRSSHHDGPTSGAVLADRAQALSIDGVKADLDPGADVRWSSERGAVRVEQRVGTASWRVDGDSKLVIDAGATVASVEATGASLRVEVQMNAMDGRVIGASALTAAAVAMVTVVVYEGYVKVSSAGPHVVIVEPGSTYQVPQPAPPPPVVAGGPDETAPSKLPSEGRPAAGSGEPANVTTTRCDEIECVLSNYADACCAMYRSGTPSPNVADGGTSLDRAKISDAIAKVKPKIAACGEKFRAKGVVKLAVKVSPDGKVERVVVKETPTAELGDCVQAVIARATFPATDTGGSFSYPFVFDDGWQSTTCDATKLSDAGIEKMTSGMEVAALALFEQSLACTSDPRTVKLAYMASCNAQNETKAKFYFAKLSAYAQDRLEQICVRNHIDVRGGIKPLASSLPSQEDCDADMGEGFQLTRKGQHAAALAKFEAAIVCGNSPILLQLALREACASRDSTKAKLYFKQLTPAQRDGSHEPCERNKVEYRDSGPALAPVDNRVVPQQPVATGGTGLDRPMITGAITKAKPKLAACGEKFRTPGKLKLMLRVNPDGKVASADVIEAPSAELGECVQQVMFGVTFPATDTGGSFTYPFVF